MDSQEIRSIWQDIYLSKETFENPHKEFAARTGMAYQDAKQQAYVEFYSTPFIRTAFMNDNK